jgi:hypothetical protein
MEQYVVLEQKKNLGKIRETSGFPRYARGDTWKVSRNDVTRSSLSRQANDEQYKKDNVYDVYGTPI